MGLGGNTTEAIFPLNHILSGAHDINISYHCNAYPDYLVKVVFARFLHCSYLSPLPYSILWIRVTKSSLYTQGEQGINYVPHPRTYIIQNSSIRFVPSHHLFTYPIIYRQKF